MTELALRSALSPRRPTPWPIESIWRDTLVAPGSVRGGPLPVELRARLAARLEIPLRSDRPTVIANFVATLDGVVALDRAGTSGGREISGGFEPDRFLMGLIRATADAVLVGAGTARASRRKAWTPDAVHPPSAGSFDTWRRDLGLTAQPTTVIVTRSGRLDLGRAHDRDGAPLIVVTTDEGGRRLRNEQEVAGIEIVPLATHGPIQIDTLLTFLGQQGFRLIVSEAGPTLFGELVGAGAVDELFLTIAPRLVGRSPEARRLGLVEGVAFLEAFAPRARLREAMRSEDYLFLRYDLRAQEGEGVS